MDQEYSFCFSKTFLRKTKTFQIQFFILTEIWYSYPLREKFRETNPSGSKCLNKRPFHKTPISKQGAFRKTTIVITSPSNHIFLPS